MYNRCTRCSRAWPSRENTGPVKAISLGPRWYWSKAVSSDAVPHGLRAIGLAKAARSFSARIRHPSSPERKNRRSNVMAAAPLPAGTDSSHSSLGRPRGGATPAGARKKPPSSAYPNSATMGAAQGRGQARGREEKAARFIIPKQRQHAAGQARRLREEIGLQRSLVQVDEGRHKNRVVIQETGHRRGPFLEAVQQVALRGHQP